MKKNAILIAAIAFVAGCAHQQNGYVRSDYDAYQDNQVYTTQAPMMTTETVQRDAEGRVVVESDPPVALQHDPAAESVGGTAEFESNTSENWETDLQADSSNRGGSLRAQGADLLDAQAEGPVTDRINRLYEADSSERGTSLRARGYDPVTDAEENTITTKETQPSRLQATSGERGAALQRTSDPALDSEVTLEDENFSTSDRGQIQSTTTYEDDGSQGVANLNASNRIEENMTGEYELEERLEGQAVGGPAGRETDQGSDAQLEVVEKDLEDVNEDSELLYRSNPAHGVGSLTAPNTAANAAAMTEMDDQMSPADARLAQAVKRRLTTESTGTYGLMSPLVAKNVKVNSQNGVVTLKGTVPTERDKKILEIRARELPGVEEVKNELKVSPEGPSIEPATTHDLEEIHNTIQD